ncbi:MAG: YdcF family protein [Alphaproteobacteria bacterium]|nr:YdcF family protein [Alphaproteobacteria bacterium]
MNTLAKWLGISFSAAGLVGVAATANYARVLNNIDHVQNHTPHTDAIVVLTGGRNRIQTARELHHRQTYAVPLLISGAPLYFNNHGRRKEHVGYSAQNTIGNAIETAHWIKQLKHEGLPIHSLTLVTARTHMPRALAEMRRHIPADIKIHPHIVTQEGRQGYHWRFITEAFNYHVTLSGGSSALRSFLGRTHLVNPVNAKGFTPSRTTP